MRFFHATTVERIVGTLASWEGEQLTVEVVKPGHLRGRVTFVVDSITKFEMRTGQTSSARAGLWIGILAGGAAGAVWCDNFGRCDKTLVAAGLFALPGALLGALIGSHVRTERWEEVPLDQFRVSIVPQRDGRFALGLSVRF